MLRLIPKYPQKISTPELLKKLQAQGYDIDLRTLQRDLTALSGSSLFPFTSTEGTKPLSWYWPQDFNRLQLPIMTPEEALAFKLVEQFLDPLLPLSVKSQLSDYFHIADSTLKVSPLSNWLNKVRIIPDGLTLRPAQIESDVLPVIYQALLQNRYFSASYERADEVINQYEVNPLGLVFRSNAIYLVATLRDYPDIRQLALHRFKTATLLDKPAKTPDSFTLDHYIEQGEFDYRGSDNELDLKLKIGAYLKKHLTETPLSTQQHFVRLDEDYYQLNVTIKDTEQLRWWLHSFSTAVEVLEPVELRTEFSETARALNKMYKKS